MKAVIGIDTSCYTSSVAAVSQDGELITHHRMILNVSEGERGLQQSKAVFQHIQNLPVLVTELLEQLSDADVMAICVSTKPRPIEESYMPVFIVGQNFAQVSARFLKIPLFETTHQEGHIMAGLWSSGSSIDPSFIAIHLSGGTTELLDVTMKGTAMDIHLIGGTTDLHAGQFVDRVGVSMGLRFPAGPELEKLAERAVYQDIIIPSSVNGLTCSFSGAESQAQRYIHQGVDRNEIAWASLRCVSNTLEKLIIHSYSVNRKRDFLIVGGVASNRIIRNHLRHRIEKHGLGIRIYFSDPALSSDNAVGTALLGLRKYLAEER